MLLDTSGLLALLFKAETQHEEAVRLFQTSLHKTTHSYVIAELFALAQARKYPRSPVVEFVNDLLTHPAITIVWVDEALTREAISLLANRADKAYSLCDAVSFVLMHTYKIEQALSTDRHFEQEGFRRLLAP